MTLKKFLIVIIIAIILSSLAYLINLNQYLPAVVAYFCISLLTAFITTTIPNDFNTSGKPKRKRKDRRPATLLNEGQKEIGHVKWFSTNKGFGFITRENGEDIFVHFRSIEGKGHRILREGQKVEYSISEGNKGMQAEDVSAIN